MSYRCASEIFVATGIVTTLNSAQWTVHSERWTVIGLRNESKAYDRFTGCALAFQLKSGCNWRNLRHAHCSLSTVHQSLRLNELHIEGDRHIVAHQEAAGFESCVPNQPKVLAVNPGGGGKADKSEER